ncbi:hypothetical protein GCK32_017102 [Trichostrongylus colubriformis]|uniref:Uncharacterized protein n=1 Tax=Trichostrongylus colubriformis TaxID=6319 RepID=A0AAN8IRJ0_TRICO
MECAFTVTEKKSDIATVLPQRNFATCSLTINLSRLTLDEESRTEKLAEPSGIDDVVGVTSESSITPTTSCHSEIFGKKAETFVPTNVNPVESSDAKENVTTLTETDKLEEKSVEEPIPKRRRNQTYAEEELSAKDYKSP